MSAYYNDNNAYCIDWLRNLAARGLIARGDFDGRSIADVQPGDVEGHAQVHLFAGIGGWPLSLHLAGWPDDLPVWTGSCPCQPYSTAGKGLGDKDPRNLWPHFRRLIAECRPSVVFGEQTASKAGRVWLAGVRSDLEALGYAVGAADLCAAGEGAPHIRQRLFWVAYAEGERRWPDSQAIRGGEAPWIREAQGEDAGWPEQQTGRAGDCGSTCGMADCDSPRLEERGKQSAREERAPVERGGDVGRLGDAHDLGEDSLPIVPERTCTERSGGAGRMEHAAGQRAIKQGAPEPQGDGKDDGISREAGAWRGFDLVHCTDGKSRRIESGAFPLAYRLPRSVGQDEPRLRELDVLAKATETLAGAKRNRTGRLTGYGNAIVPQLAAEFVRAFMDLEKPA